MNLKQSCEAWLDLDGHDHYLMDKRKELNALAPSAEVSAMIHQITLERSVEKEKPQLEVIGEAVAEVTEPVTQQPMQDVKAQSRRAPPSCEPLPDGLNPSGGRARQSKVSILDMADEKRKG